MEIPERSRQRQHPENLLHRLIVRLGRHVLWDTLLVFVPPALTLLYIAWLLFQKGWLSDGVAMAAAMAVMALGALAVLLWTRSPSSRTVALLLDQQSGAQDHFLTLATVDPAAQPHGFMARLRHQAAGFLDRVDLQRDFPYRFKRSAYWSFVSSLLAAVVIHLFLPLGSPGRDSPMAAERLRKVAQEMAANPDLRALAREIEAIASQLESPELSSEQKQELVQQLEPKIQEQQSRQEQKDDQDLLAQAASALRDRESQLGASGEQEKEQRKGAGGIQSNARQEGQGEGKEGGESGGDGENKAGTQLSQGADQEGKSSPTEPKGKGQNSSGKNDTQKPPDPNERGGDPGKDKPGKTQDGAKEGAGTQRASSDPPPTGESPAERFYKSGEDPEGLKGAGYVTVQLPEEVMADSEGQSRLTKDPKGSRTRTQVPVSNVPLPARVPNAPTEKQRVPLEYRGILR